MFNYKFFILLIICISAYSFAQDGGKTGLSFLKLSTGARNAAMSDNGLAIANDLNSVFYNPALITSLSGTRIGITHNKWIQDASYSVFSLKSDFMDVPFGLLINTFSVPGIEIREKPGAAIGTFKAQYFAGTLSTGYGITDDISAGVSFKYLYEGLFSEEASGYAFDMGVNYHNALPGLILGIAVRNLGSMDKLKNLETELPGEVRFGGSYKIDLNTEKYSVLLTGEAQKYFQYDDTNFSLACEAGYDNLILCRLGYKTGIESDGLTAGVGVNWNSITFEYAFIPLSDELGSGNMIGLIYSF